LSELFPVTGANEFASPIRLYDVTKTTEITRHDWNLASHRLCGDQSMSFSPARDDQYIERGIDRMNIGAQAQEGDSVM